MKEENRLLVYYDSRLVGTLALTSNHMAAFAYADSWLENGFSISPFSLPLRKEVFVPSKTYFDGLFGVFSDSLPDAWGRILLNRILKRNGISENSVSVLDRLAIVGNSGMGALTYQPEKKLTIQESISDLDELARQCEKILNTEDAEKLDELYRLGGISGGARPKIMTNIDGEDWIIKFPAHLDGKEAGKMEFDYAECAKACGIEMTEVRLFPSKNCMGYFGTKRFDRIRGKRMHMLTAAALLELDFESPCLDYHSLMKLTKILTRENQRDIESMFRRMCFNVFAHNMDDHAKNFTFIYDEAGGVWRLSPAYDLTYSNTYFGEHTTTIDGNGKNPGYKEILEVGIKAGMSKSRCDKIVGEIEACVNEMLGAYLTND